MKKYLEKKTWVSTDFCLIETDAHLLSVRKGKVGKPASSATTEHCGTEHEAVEELEKLVNKYLESGYILITAKDIEDDYVLDKAKWHFDGNFPDGLDPYQAYVHTGLFLGWLINNNLISGDFYNENENDIRRFKSGEISCVQIYCENLDGVLTSDELNKIGFSFSKSDFDFEKGMFLSDYETLFADNLDSLYCVKDNKENFHKLSEVLDRRFKEWKAHQSQ